MFDVEGARKAGYQDAEIAAHLAGMVGFDLPGAKKAGYSDGEIVAELAGKAQKRAEIPVDPNLKAPPSTAPQVPEKSGGLMDRAVGVAETGLTLATGATGGALGMAGGFLGGLAASILSGQYGTQEALRMVEEAAQQGGAKLTYQPRTSEGQRMAYETGEVLKQAIPVLPLTGEVQAIARGASAAAPAVKATAAAAVDATKQGVRQASATAQQAVQRISGATRPTPGTLGSVGSAGTDVATQRIRTAEAFGFTGEKALTKGQASRDAAQLKFETEAAKMPSEGAPLRERLIAQNEQILSNFDGWLDQTGAEAPNLRAVGVTVDGALVRQAAADKMRIRAAYKAAEAAGELEQPVTLQSLVSHLNDSAPDAATAPILDVAKRRAIQTGIAVDGPDGLVAQPATLKAAEKFRQAINRATDYEATNVRQAAIMKGLVDEATDGLGGNLYKQARGLRTRYAQNYENRATISKLLDTRRGTADRAIAFEDVFDQSVLKGSLDDVRNVRRVLQRGGAEGQQAWKELQGQTVRWIREKAEQNVATDSKGNRVVSPAGLDKAIRELDADGRLDFIFGKKGAQDMRDINELAKIARTVPPEAAVNTSNTASALLWGFADIVPSSMTGLPLPIATMTRIVRQHVRNKQLQARINEALGRLDKKQRAAQPTQTAPSSAAIH